MWKFVSGEVLVDHWRISGKVIDVGQTLAKPILRGWFGQIRNHSRWFELLDQLENQRAIVLNCWKVKHKNFVSESIVPNFIKSFFDIRKCSYLMFSLLKWIRNDNFYFLVWTCMKNMNERRWLFLDILSGSRDINV